MRHSYVPVRSAGWLRTWVFDFKALRRSNSEHSRDGVVATSGIPLASNDHPEWGDTQRESWSPILQNPSSRLGQRRFQDTSSRLVAGFHRPMETGNMDSMYGVVLGVILLFPWSIVAMMVAGTFWGRIRAFVQVRRRR